jgi:hypothetical protein
VAKLGQKTTVQNLLINVYKQLTEKVSPGKYVVNVASAAFRPQPTIFFVHMLKTHLGCLTNVQVIPPFDLNDSS